MIPELGQVFLIGGLIVSIVLGVFPLIGAANGNAAMMRVGRNAALAQFLLIGSALVMLTWAFIVQDFSVEYVARNSNSSLPMQYRISAVWGSHEGSLLLWEWILCLWTLAVALFSKRLPDAFRARTLAILGWVSCGFLLFVIFTSNPFTRLLPAAADGLDLNPLLQDPGLIIHPPTLYMGYVGFSVAFAFAVAALLGRQVDRDWVRWSRPWTHVAWAFLTLGIALGSWWAYYELGWGGWWFWDPVENASFMPWLVGTALIHSLAVTEKRGLFKAWTLLLSIIAFSLSLLGTFLVRSGVLVSVHAFASDPSRGLFILGFLGICVGGALALFAWRGPSLRAKGGFDTTSRESFLLANNALLLITAALILIGTLYPLFLDALNLGKISVGPPYFNVVFLIPTIPLMFLLAVGMHSVWKKGGLSDVKRPLLVLFAVSLLLGLVIPPLAYGEFHPMTVVGLTAGIWVILSSLYEPWQRLSRKQSLSRSVLGMTLAHIGVGVFAIGVTVTQTYRVEKDMALKPGQSVELKGYKFDFVSTRPVTGPNYDAIEAEVVITRDGRPVATLHPQKRSYRVQTMPMTESGIDVNWSRDLFVAMGDDLGAGAWSMRVQYKPMVRYIWLGALIMALGGSVAITDRRYRRRRSAADEAVAAAGTATAR